MSNKVSSISPTKRRGSSRTRTPSKTNREQHLIPVSMRMTETDVARIEDLLPELNARSRAGVVSQAVGLTSTINDIVKNGGKILVEDAEGNVRELLLTGI